MEREAGPFYPSPIFFSECRMFLAGARVSQYKRRCSEEAAVPSSSSSFSSSSSSHSFSPGAPKGPNQAAETHTQHSTTTTQKTGEREREKHAREQKPASGGLERNEGYGSLINRFQATTGRSLPSCRTSRRCGGAIARATAAAQQERRRLQPV